MLVATYNHTLHTSQLQYLAISHLFPLRVRLRGGKLFPYKGRWRDPRQPVGDRRATDSESDSAKAIPISLLEVSQRTP